VATELNSIHLPANGIYNRAREGAWVCFTGIAPSPTGRIISQLCSCLLCDHCGAQNPQDCVRHIQAHDICIHFVTAGACSVQAMDLTLRRTLGPRVPVSSVETLRRLLAYLGALPEALNEFDKCRESLGKGNVRITLQPGCKNLLKVDSTCRD
jgi:hypothetical protein